MRMRKVWLIEVNRRLRLDRNERNEHVDLSDWQDGLRRARVIRLSLSWSVRKFTYWMSTSSALHPKKEGKRAINIGCHKVSVRSDFRAMIAGQGSCVGLTGLCAEKVCHSPVERRTTFGLTFSSSESCWFFVVDSHLTTYWTPSKSIRSLARRNQIFSIWCKRLAGLLPSMSASEMKSFKPVSQCDMPSFWISSTRKNIARSSTRRRDDYLINSLVFSDQYIVHHLLTDRTRIAVSSIFALSLDNP